MQMTEKPIQLYNASAGSGKTYSLVKKYISFLLTNTSESFFKNILAVTFTNKAAQEMKSRLISTLEEMSSKNYEENEMLQSISKETGVPVDELHARAKNSLQFILHHYSWLSFFTLDKFSLRLLKSFSKELELSNSFSVELDIDEYYQNAFFDFKEDLEPQSPIYRSVINHYLNALDEEKSINNIDKNTLAELKNYDSEIYLPYVQANRFVSSSDLEVLKKELWQQRSVLDQEIKDLAQESATLIRQQGLDISDFKGSASYGLLAWIEKIAANGLAKPDEFQKPEKFDKEKWETKNNVDKHDLIEGVLPELISNYQMMQKRFYTAILNQNVLKQIFPLQLYQKVQQKLNEVKEEEDKIFINEFKPIISKHLQEQPSAFIYEKLGNHFQHIFFDEFQDTSQMEWDNFKPLRDQITSQNEGGTLSIIGDPKQSIYRFKGGNPEIMLDIIEEAEKSKRNTATESLYYNHPLKKNYRSQKNIVEFNNQLYQHFAQDVPNEMYQNLFTKMGIQEPNKQDDKGYVEFLVLNHEEYEENENERILSIISDAEKRNIPLGEVAVLVQTNKKAQKIAQYLLAQKPELEIATEESLLLKNNDAVLSIVSLLFALEHPDNPTYVYDFVYHLSKSSSLLKNDFEEEILRLFEKPEKALQNFEIQYDINFKYLQKQTIDLYSFIESLIRNLHFYKAQKNFLIHFLDCIYEQENQQVLDITSFLDFCERKSDSLKITAPDNSNALNIMTIHKAKGLEFSIVILPNFKESSSSTIWLPIPDNYKGLNFVQMSLKDAESIQALDSVYEDLVNQQKLENEVDELCRYYVATTRAENELYIFLDYNNTNRFHDYLVEKGEIETPITSGKNNNTKEFEDVKIVPFQEGKMIFSESQPKEAHSLPIAHQSFSWRNRIKIAQELGGSFRKEAIEKGNKIHEILAKIYTESDIKNVLDAAIREGFIQNTEFPYYENLIRSLLQEPKVQPYYSKDYTVYNERDLVVNDLKLRPDRLMKKDNQFSIIDYKTGLDREEDTEQIKEYRGALESIGYEVSECLLVYLENDHWRIREVP